MRFGAVRGIIQPLTRTLVCRISTSSTSSFLRCSTGNSCQGQISWIPILRHFSIFSEANNFNSLTDTRFSKRRPIDNPRRKRSTLRPPGPYAWVKHVPGQPIQPSNPNEGSVKSRNQKKRIKLHCAFIKAEAKKRKSQVQEAKRKKIIKRVERKMAAVAREREWAQRLAELQQLENENKKSSMA